MVRDGDTWREVSWDEAFARCEELIHGVLDRHGITAATAFIGNPVGHSFTLGRYMPLFIGQSGMSHIYSSGTIDQWPKNVSCILMYGNMWKIPAPDIQRTDYLICMGGNPQASGGSLLACPDVLGELDGIRARGGKVVVIDPRRTGTADHADEWVPILPGTDAAFLLAMCNVLFAEGLTTLGALEEKVKGVDIVRDVCAAFTPESVEAFCRVPADTIRRLAREFAAAPDRRGLRTHRAVQPGVRHAGVVAGRRGQHRRRQVRPSRWAHVGQAGRVADGVDGVDREGRSTRLRQVDVARARACPRCSARSRPRSWPRRSRRPGDGQIKMLFTVAGNPVISVPDSARLEAALPELECMISVDNYLNETTRFADVILPGPSPLETPHFDEVLWGWAARSGANWSDPVFPPSPDRPDEGRIVARLGWLCTGGKNEDFDFETLDDAWFTALCRSQKLDAADILPQYDGGGAERIIDLQVRTGPWGDRYGEVPDGLTLEQIKAQPHGIDRGPMVSRRRRDGVHTRRAHRPRARVHRRGPPAPAGAASPTDRPIDGFRLVSRRHLRSKNSWMHNVKVLVKGKDRCTLLVHPDDAAGRRAGRRRSCPRDVGGGQRRGAGRGERRDDARRGVAAPRVGSRPSGHPHGGGPGARRRQQQPARPHALLRHALEQPRGERHPGGGGPGLRPSAGWSDCSGSPATYDAPQSPRP